MTAAFPMMVIEELQAISQRQAEHQEFSKQTIERLNKERAAGSPTLPLEGGG